MRNLFGGVETDGMIVGQDNPDASAVFKGAELFELLRLFEKSRRPAYELFEKIAAVAVKAHVAERSESVGVGS